MDGGLRILIVGDGYGMRTALRLERLLRPGEATVAIAGPRAYMTCQPLLAEAAAGNLEPRHVVVPHRTSRGLTRRARGERAGTPRQLGPCVRPGRAWRERACARRHRPVPGVPGPHRRRGVRAARRVRSSGRAAVRRRGCGRDDRVLAARLPFRPGERPGALTAGNPAGRRLRRPGRRRERLRAPRRWRVRASRITRPGPGCPVSRRVKWQGSRLRVTVQ